MEADNQPPQTDTEAGRLLHARFLAGDVTAFAEICELHLPILTDRLSRRYLNLDDPHLVDTAVVEALLNYQNNPERYDPLKSSLDRYLLMSANGDLLNLIKRYKNDLCLLPLAEIVELGGDGAEYTAEVADETNVEKEVEQRLSPTWQNVCSILPDERDQEILTLMMDGIRETRVFAAVLGISDLPDDQQAKAVKQHKDRIKKMLQRHIDPSELKP